MDPQDAKIIESIPLSRIQTVDRDGWHFTKSRIYTVKSRYQVERVYPDSGRTLLEYGPSVLPLKAHCWKIRCPPKIEYFLWQLVTRCIAMKKNLRSRGIHEDTTYVQCGAQEEFINHVFFECPLEIQVWALSRIPLNPNFFPLQFLFANMDHLFWRVTPEMEDHQFAWILWYI